MSLLYFQQVCGIAIVEFVVQLDGIVAAIDGDDVCHIEGLTLVAMFGGWNFCTPDNPCADGEGDCNIDDDCEV